MALQLTDFPQARVRASDIASVYPLKLKTKSPYSCLP